MSADFVVGDVVEFYFMKYNTQIITEGEIVEIIDPNMYTIRLASGLEADVPLSHIYKRKPRPNEVTVQKPVSEEDPDAQINSGVSGVKFKHRRVKYGHTEDKD